MGDAVGDGDVRAADPEQTIDAAEPRQSPIARPLDVIHGDYPQLFTVDRRHYLVSGEIAKGGMGRVLEARDLRLGRAVAIKELLPKNRDAARRFEREARITARLQHPSIIHVYEAGVWPGGEPFYAMPKVSGRSLDKVVADKHTLAERLALLPHVIAVADALAYAHNENIIHRDLKPANILVGEFGETVVIDWGLAKELGTPSDPKESMQLRLRATAEETVSGGVVGTPAYMAPEQAHGRAVDQRADVYALGALLYKVLAGEPPYRAANADDALALVKSQPPTPLQVLVPEAPAELVTIVAKAMARDPNDRYITASALAQDLKRFETGQLVAAHRYTVGQLIGRWLRKHRIVVAVASAAASALVVIALFSVQRIVREKHRAELERANAQAGRVQLLEEHGRAELVAGHAGAALAYLAGAAEDGRRGGARGFLIADAMRPFMDEIVHIEVGNGDVTFATSRDGSELLTGGAGDVTLWRTDGTRLRSFGTHGITRAVAIDPEMRFVAAAGDDAIVRVWSVSGAAQLEVRGHEGAVNALAFSSDGKTLFSVGDDGVLNIVDVATGSLHRGEACHTGPAISVEESPDHEHVLTAGVDGVACVMDARTGGIKLELRGHRARLNSATWSADGQYIVTASDDGTARVWNARFDRSRSKLALAPLVHRPGSTVGVALFSYDGHVITAGSDLMINVWELPAELPIDGTPASAKLVRTLAGHAGAIITGAVDEEHLVTGAFDGVAKVWDLRTGHQLGTLEPADVVTSTRFIDAGRAVITGSRDGTIRLWRTRGAKVHHELDSRVHAIAVSSRHVVAAGTDDSRVTLVEGDRKRVLAGHLGRVLGVAFTSDGMKLASGGEDDAVIVWDVSTGAQLATLATGPVRALASEGDDLVALTERGVEVWSLSRRVRVRSLPLHAQASAIAIDARHIAAVGRDGGVALWNRDGRLVIERLDRASPYGAVALTPTTLVAAGEGVARVWTLDGDKLGRDLEIEGPTGIVSSVATNGAFVITAGDDGRARVWDAEKGKLLGTRDDHELPLSGVALDGDTLWTASQDGTVGAWDVHVDEHSATELAAFMREKHVVEHLDADNVVRRGGVK